MAVEKTIEQLQLELSLAEQKLKVDKENNELLEKKAKLEIEISDRKAKSLLEEIKVLETIKGLSESDRQVISEKKVLLDQLLETTKNLKVEEENRLKILKQSKQIQDEIIKKQKEEESRAVAQGKKLANLLGFDESQKNSLTYQIFANPDKVFDGFKSAVQDAGGVTQAVFLSVAMKVQEATVAAFFAFDTAAASLNKATGAAGSLNGVLEATSRGATRFGISFSEAGRATEGLYNNLFTFNSLSQSTQALLITNAAKLEQLGISSAESAKSIATLSQVMGQSDVQSSKTINQMAALGIAIGKSPQQISQDFAQASNSLAGYGNRMVDVFKDLEIQSKATGVAVGDLISVVEKFQSFEGAATAAGKLNAALGGNFINTMELLEASAENPAKAIDLLRASLDDAGMSFSEMSFFEKKMIADAAGFKSIQEATQVLSMSNAEREIAIKNIEAQRVSQEKLDKAIQASISVQQQFQMIMANFAIVFGPAVEAIREMSEGILKFADSAGGKVIISVLGWGLAMAGLIKTISFFGTVIKGATSLFSLFGAGAAAATPAIVETGTAAGAAAPGIAALGVALLEVGAAIALTGAGIGLMLWGISNLIDSIVNLSGVLTTELTVNLLGLGLAMGEVGLAFNNPLVLLGMAAFATSLAAIVGIINQLDEDKSFNFKVITESLTKANTIVTATNVGQQTKDMVEAINTFSLNNTQADSLSKILKSLPQNQPTQVAQAGNTVVEVYIGTEKLKDIVTKTVTRQVGGTTLNPATLPSGGKFT